MKRTPVILSIAGSDSSCGAGIQADLKTISALGGYAATAITAITAQNTLGVQAVFPLPTEAVKKQIESVMDDLQPDAVKIGMVNDAAVVETISSILTTYRPSYIVYDPVMISTSGRRLMASEAIYTIQDKLFPLCTLITPNLHEAELLYGQKIQTIDEMKHAALTLQSQYRTAILVKGGHLEGNEMCDILCANKTLSIYKEDKIATANLHGTGCTLSSAIATYLAKGHELTEAVQLAKNYTTLAIHRGINLHIGHGNGPLGHF